MRNLKRALSLALASIMVLGMMVIGAGAANVYDSFPDKEEIVNKDAVSMLTTLGIINGEDSGKFNPTGNVTRSQMAKMISVIMNKGADNNALYADVNSGLTDISSSWAKGHINFCFTRGIIAGRGDGRFDPEANVTAAEAAKMLLVAAGYDPAKEGFTGGDWAVNVSAMASKLGVYNNYEKSTMDPLSRDDAALLIYNALDVEMIQKYDSSYPINFADHRTILSVMYGVYKMEGVVISNEWAALNGTDYEEAAPTGKTILENVKIYASTTENTTTGEYEDIKGQVTLNTTTTADMLGKTVTLYVKKTTILSNSTVMGVFLRDSNNVVKTTAESQDTMKDFLKNTGMSTDSDTKYYVNYGYMASESAATKALGFQSGDRFTSVSDKTNGSGVEMTVIDNDNDGKVEYVLYMQETLTQVVATNANKETTTLNDFNKNKAIDNDKLVTDETLAEGDVVLTTTYGGRYYVTAPEVITGKMDSFSSSKTKEQYIEVGGEKYYPSYDKFSADSANNTYVFNVLNCGKTDGVDFDIEYDFILDSAGTVIAYRPSEKSLYNYALILDSGYNPGSTNNNPKGEVKVLLPDGTEGTYTLNFSASAQNIGDQLYNGLGTASQRKDNGIEELKGFLGSSVVDNTTTKPDNSLVGGMQPRYSVTANKSGHAEGYVIGYSLNDANVLTITSIVGSNIPNGTSSHYNPINSESPKSVDNKLSSDYDTGSARVKYGSSDYYTIDQNTVAFYYTTDSKGDTVYGVAVGYSKMADVKSGVDFVGATVKKSDRLMGTILFDAEGVVAEKDYAYVLSRSSTVSGYITLNVVLMDGTASTLKVERSDWDAITDTHGDDAYNTVYSFTTKNDVSEVTWGFNDKAVEGYVVKLRDGTVALHAKNSGDTVGAEQNVYSYDKNIWNVENIAVGDNATSGAFAENVYKDTILVLDSKENTVRAAFIKSVYDGQVDGGHDFDWNLSNYKTLYAYHTVADIHKAFDEGYNVLMRGDFSLNANLYIPAGKIVYVDGNLNEAGYHVSGGGKLWVKGNYTVSGDINVDTQIGNTSGDLILNASNVTVYSSVALNGNVRTSDGTAKNLTINGDASLYASKNVSLNGGTLTINGHIEANDYTTGNVVVNSAKTLIARGNVNAANITVGGTAKGTMTVAGNLNATGALIVNAGSTLTLTKSGAAFNAGSLDVKGTLNMSAVPATVTGNASVTGTMTAKSLAVTGTLISGGKLTTTGVISAAGITLNAGSETTASSVTGTLVNNGGKLTTTDKTAPVTVGGELAGEIAGPVTLSSTKDNSVESGKTLTVNDLTTNATKKLDVSGTLIVNGTLNDATNITSTTNGAKVTFGKDATVGTVNSKFVYADGTVVAQADYAGKTFTYDKTTGEFVYSVNADATADIKFDLTSPAKDSNNTITTSGKDVTVNVQKETASVTLSLTEVGTKTVTKGTDTSNVAIVSSTGITVDTSSIKTNGGNVAFTVVVSETGKASITYNVKVIVSGTEPTPPAGAITAKNIDAAKNIVAEIKNQNIALKNAVDGNADMKVSALLGVLNNAKGVYEQDSLGNQVEVAAATAIDNSNVGDLVVKGEDGKDYSLSFAKPEKLAVTSENAISSTSDNSDNQTFEFVLTTAPDAKTVTTASSALKVYSDAACETALTTQAYAEWASGKLTLKLNNKMTAATEGHKTDVYVRVAGAVLNSDAVKLTCLFTPEKPTMSNATVTAESGNGGAFATLTNSDVTGLTYKVYESNTATSEMAGVGATMGESKKLTITFNTAIEAETHVWIAPVSSQGVEGERLEITVNKNEG